MANASKLPIALIGCGNWGQHILRDLITLDCEVTAVCQTPESAKRAEKFGAKYIVETLSKIHNPAGIIIATPTTTHLDIIEAVVTLFNVPIFVEKPLGTDLEKAKSLATQVGYKIFIMDKWRYHHGIEALARIAKQQELGKVIGLSIKQLGWGCYHQDVDFIDTLLPHTLTIAYEILGEIPVPISSYRIRRENSSVALHGILGNKPWCNFSVAINSPFYCREVILECAQGVAVLNEDKRQEINIYHTNNPLKNALAITEKRQLPTEPPLFRELRLFLDYLNGGTEPKSNLNLGIKVMETIKKLRTMTNNYKLHKDSDELNKAIR